MSKVPGLENVIRFRLEDRMSDKSSFVGEAKIVVLPSRRPEYDAEAAKIRGEGLVPPCGSESSA